MAKKSQYGPIHPLYGVAINDAAKSSDLSRMKQVAAEADAMVAQHATITAALAKLKTKIAALEKKATS